MKGNKLQVDKRSEYGEETCRNASHNVKELKVKTEKRRENKSSEIFLFGSETCGEKRYSLGCVEIEQCRRYLIYANDGKEDTLELLGADADRAKGLYDLICEGELEVCQLWDVVRDSREEEILECF